MFLPYFSDGHFSSTTKHSQSAAVEGPCSFTTDRPHEYTSESAVFTGSLEHFGWTTKTIYYHEEKYGIFFTIIINIFLPYVSNCSNKTIA